MCGMGGIAGHYLKAGSLGGILSYSAEGQPRSVSFGKKSKNALMA
jgi:hypothetical protein